MRSELRAPSFSFVLPKGSMWNVFSALVAECHAARIVLGREAPADPHDPFWLAGTWLEIGVETERGNYAVSIAGGTIDQGLRVLTEAKAFARGHVESHDRPALKGTLILISLLDVHVMLENPGHRVCCTQ